MRFCFVQDKACDRQCMAYSDEDAVNPNCLLLEMGATFIRVLKQVQKTETKHPRSAPPPEVK